MAQQTILGGSGVLWGTEKVKINANFSELYSSVAGKAPALGEDDNYVTDAEKVKLSNLSGTNTGDQDLSGYVETTGNETIAGVKTFSSSPVVPTPTTDMQAATKKYVDDNSGTGGGYTNLTEFIGQTAWRLFYSDGSGDVKELAIGADGTYLKSNGASAAPSFGAGASGEMVYPGAGIPVSTGSAWGTSLALDTDLSSVSASDDTVPSAKATKAALDLKDNAAPAGLAMTSSAALTEAQLLANKFFTNSGASGAVVATLPALTYPITRTFLVSAAQVFSIKPPSGETLDTTITPALDADDKISSPATIYSKVVVTNMPVGAGWVWSVDVVRGTWTDGGA